MNDLNDAWQMFRKEYRCSVDRMLCNPALRNEFLATARAVTGIQDEEQLLWAVVTLRKKKELAPHPGLTERSVGSEATHEKPTEFQAKPRLPPI